MQRVVERGYLANACTLGIKQDQGGAHSHLESEIFGDGHVQSLFEWGCGAWLLSAGVHWGQLMSPQALIHPKLKEKRSAALFAAAPHVLLGSLSNEKAGLQVQLLLHVFCMHE